MDKIDEWMKRAFKEEPSKSEKEELPKKKGKFFKKRNKPSKNKERFNFKKQQDKRQENRPKPNSSSKTKKVINKPIKPTQILKGKLKIIPLGGLNEVGKNLMVVEYENDIIIIDMGFEFPSSELFGIDYVIPDVSYLEQNRKRIRGVVLTHGHLDHIGGIPYVLPKLDFPPVYGTRLTIGLVEKRVQEFKQTNLVKLHTINPDEPLRLGHFLCRFFRVSHSIPDAVGVVIETPVGKIVHTGDFKFDESPARNQIKPDIRKIEELGNQNILALFCESTNSLKEGHSMPEQEVGRVLGEVIKEAPGRVIVASFSSQIGRMQQILDAAENDQRKVFVSGRSMRTNLDIAGKLGYLKYKQDQVRDVKKYKNDPDKETLILTTGSQGEPISALTRMASGEHPHVKIKKGDTVILSSSPIIGNERAIYNVINNLASLGAEVIHNQIADVHTSGHGKREEIKKMINLVKPKYLIPIHGEYFMRQELGRMANKSCNIPSERVLMIGNGDVLIGEKGKIYKSNEKVEAKYILIDGSGEGTLDSQVQYDRSMMSQNGALLILVHIDKKSKRLKKTPDVVSRGFIYMHESEEITEEIAEVAGKAYQSINEKNKGANRKDIKQYIKQFVDKYAQKKLNRKPLIIPLIIES